MARLPLGIHAWRWLGILVTPLTPLLLRERAARGKEDSARMGERLGVASAARPDGRLVWIHGASVGESLAALPLIEKLLAEDIRVLVTSGTVTSANMMQARLPAGAIHQYVPLDTPRAIARFLDHWRPAAGLFVESDLWPNLLLEAQRRGVKLALINARISERSAAGWRRAPHTARTLLGVFNKILAQDEDFAARFRALGIDATHLDSRSVIVTDRRHTQAAPDLPERLVNGGRANPIGPRRPAHIARGGERRPVQLLHIQAERRLLRRVLRTRQRSGHCLGGELVAEARVVFKIASHGTVRLAHTRPKAQGPRPMG